MVVVTAPSRGEGCASLADQQEISMRKRKVSYRQCLRLGILVLVSVSVVILWSFRTASSCSWLSEKLCEPLLTTYRTAANPVTPARVKTDEEIASLALSKDILSQARARPILPKLAFLFLTRGPLPHERIWERFFHGHEGMYSVFVHASEEGYLRNSVIFKDRDIRSKKVGWGKIDMIDAERRLLASALLEDNDNEFFILLSESCIPLWKFEYIYKYFLNSSISYVDCFQDPGPHGAGRYLDGMKPEVNRVDFSKGAQWFAVHRRHALLIVADSLYYGKFKTFCKPGDENHNCYPDEHYVQTFLHIVDPQGISNWSVTHVDWKNQKWHPRLYNAEDINVQLIKEIQNITESLHVSSDSKNLEFRQPCTWNGLERPCYLFARKFMEDTSDRLEDLLFNSTF